MGFRCIKKAKSKFKLETVVNIIGEFFFCHFRDKLLQKKHGQAVWILSLCSGGAIEWYHFQPWVPISIISPSGLRAFPVAYFWGKSIKNWIQYRIEMVPGSILQPIDTHVPIRQPSHVHYQPFRLTVFFFFHPLLQLFSTFGARHPNSISIDSARPSPADFSPHIEWTIGKSTQSRPDRSRHSPRYFFRQVGRCFFNSNIPRALGGSRIFINIQSAEAKSRGSIITIGNNKNYFTSHGCRRNFLRITHTRTHPLNQFRHERASQISNVVFSTKTLKP